MAVNPTLREIPPLCQHGPKSAAEIQKLIAAKAKAQDPLAGVPDITFPTKLKRALDALVAKNYLTEHPPTQTAPTTYTASAAQVAASNADPWTAATRVGDFAKP